MCLKSLRIKNGVVCCATTPVFPTKTELTTRKEIRDHAYLLGLTRMQALNGRK
jgi:hypothetical protein